MAADPYRVIARWYDTLFEPVLARFRAKGLELYAPKPAELVLDVGCGTGAQLALYRGFGCRLAGIDPAPAMVAQARQKLGPDARIHLGDASSLPYPDGSVDLVLCSMMLHELSAATRAAVVAEATRVLTREGRMIVLDYHPGPLVFPRGWLARPVIYLVEWMAGRDHFRHHLEFLTGGGLPGIASQYRLEIEATWISEGGTFGVFLARPSH